MSFLDLPWEDHSAEALAQAFSGADPHLAALVMAELIRLRDNTAEARAYERELLAAMAPHQRGYRAQLWLGDRFDAHYTGLTFGAEEIGFLYDDDLVTLIDSLGADPRTPWASNVAAAKALVTNLTRAGGRLRSLRLWLFEGTSRIASELQASHAAHLVTHLVLARQTKTPEAAVAARFPSLIGLSCEARDVAMLLADGAPELRSLIVEGPCDVRSVLSLATSLPRLRHLGFWYSMPDAVQLESILSHPLIARLTSLELFHANDANAFPFAALLAARGRLEHLEHLGLPGHCVAPSTLAAFADWPPVSFVSHERRERLAFDLWTRGWAETMR